MPVRKILKATVLSRTNLSHAPVKLRMLTPPTPVQKLVIYFSFFLSPFVFCYLKVFVIFNLHLPVSFRIYFGIFLLYLRPSNGSWNKFRMTGWGSSLRLLWSVHSNLLTLSFRIYFGIFSLYSRSLLWILKQVQDDGRRVKFFPSWLILFYGRGKRHENFPHQWSGRMKIFEMPPR